jgi:hypothetical protein
MKLQIISIILFLFLILFSNTMRGQDKPVIPELNQKEEIFVKEIKFIDEFIVRFNNVDIFNGYLNIETKSNLDGKQKTELLKSIFGKEDVSRIEMLSTVFCRDSLKAMGETKLRDFIAQVTDSIKPVKLSILDKELYAELTCDISYKNKPAQLILIMQREISDEKTKASSWVAVGCFSTFLNVSAKHKTNRGVYPKADDFNFVALQAVFEDKDNLERLTHKNYQIDNLSVLLYAVKTGDITLKSVKKIRYHFLQIPSWIMVVEQYSRNTTNSGWLISTLEKKNNLEKKQYKRNLYLE